MKQGFCGLTDTRPNGLRESSSPPPTPPSAPWKRRRRSFCGETLISALQPDCNQVSKQIATRITDRVKVIRHRSSGLWCQDGCLGSDELLECFGAQGAGKEEPLARVAVLLL